MQCILFCVQSSQGILIFDIIIKSWSKNKGTINLFITKLWEGRITKLCMWRIKHFVKHEILAL